MNLEGFEKVKIKPGTRRLTQADTGILSRLNRMAEDVTADLNTYNFDKAAQDMYDFVWRDFCDWYIELAKPRLNPKTVEKGSFVQSGPGACTPRETVQYILCEVLERSMKLMHPFMPFITEEIWQALPHEGESIMVSAWPKPDPKASDPGAEEHMELIKSVVTAIRNSRNEAKVNPGLKVEAHIKTADAGIKAVLEANSDYVTDTAKLSKLLIGAELKKPELCGTSVLPGMEIFVLLDNVIDKAKEKERMQKELEKVIKELSNIANKLANGDFIKRAPAAVVSSEKEKQTMLLDKQAKLNENLKRISQ